MKRYGNTKRKKIYRDENTLDGRMTCDYQDCSSEIFHKNMFMKHLTAAHKINIESKNLAFPSVEQFISWKEKQEFSNSVYFFQTL